VRPLYIVLIIAIIALASGGLWLRLAPSSQKPSSFFDTKQDYDTTGGQPMRPRWKE